MSELNKYSQKIDLLIANNDFKAAINYITSLKQNGVNPQDISFLQVYISKNMNQKKQNAKNVTSQSTLSIGSNESNLNSKQEQQQPSQQNIRKSTNYSSFMMKTHKSQPSLLSGLKSKIDQRNVSIESDEVSTSMNHLLSTQETQQQISLHNEPQKAFRSLSKILGAQKAPQSIKVKLPTLSQLDISQYEPLKKLLKKGFTELESQGKVHSNHYKQNGFLETAQHFYSQKKFEKSIDYFEKSMNINQTSIESAIGKGNCHRIQGNYDAAMEYYDYVNNLNPPSKHQVSILFNQATTLKCQGNHQESLNLYSKAGLLDPMNPNIFFNKALTQYNLGQVDDSIESYSKVIKLTPNDQFALLNKGFAQREVGEFESAVESFKSASEVKAKCAREFLNKGNAFYQIDKLKESFQCYKNAVQIDHSLFEAHLNMGVVLNQLGNFNEEIKCYDRVLQLRPNDIKALYNKGISLREQGHIEESLSLFEEVLKIDNKMLDSVINKGTIFYMTERYEEGIQIFQQALEIDNSSILVRIHLGQCFRAIQEKQKALKIYKEALKLNPESSEIYYEIGGVLKDSTNFKIALVHYQKAIELNPVYSEAIFERGMCLMAAKEIESAQKCFNLCIKFNSQDQAVLISKGISLMMRGQLKQAIKSFDDSLSIFHKNPHYESSSLIYKAQAHRLKSNEQHVRKALELYYSLIGKSNERYSVKLSAYNGLCSLVVNEIQQENKQFLMQQQENEVTICQINSNLYGKEIEDPHYFLLCYLSSEINKMTMFTLSEQKIINEESFQQLSIQILLRYLSLKKLQGVGSLGMGSGKHIVYMILSYIYIGFKLREKKELDESIVYFDFIQNIDKELELFCRYHCFLAYINSSLFIQANKKYSVNLGKQVKTGNQFDIYEIEFEKDLNKQDNYMYSNGQSLTEQSQQSSSNKIPDIKQPQQQQQQQTSVTPSSFINKILVQKYEKKLCCRKVKAEKFSIERDQYLNSFALQNLLNHKNIQKINYIQIGADESAYIMEPYQKYDLRFLLSRNIVNYEQRLNILLQICNGIQYLHNNRIIHSSIEAKNVLIKEQEGTFNYNNILVLLTNFAKSKILFKTYHQQFQFNSDSNSQVQHFLSAMKQISPISFLNYETDIQTFLSEDIYSVGIIFEQLLLKMPQYDRLVNNKHRKGFQISQQLHKLIPLMISNKPTKRPDISTIIESVQLEIFCLTIFSINSFSESKDFTFRNSFQAKNNPIEMKRNSTLTFTPSNQSAQSLLQQKAEQKKLLDDLPQKGEESGNGGKLIGGGRGEEEDDEIRELNDECLSPDNMKKLAKKQQQYQQFAFDLEELRLSIKMQFLFKIQQGQKDQIKQMKEKTSKIFNLSYSNLGEQASNHLFISSLNKSNLMILVAIINSITNFTKKEQLEMINKFYKQVQVYNSKSCYEDLYQYSQLKFFYRITNRVDPDKYRFSVFQKSHLKEQYNNISSIFLSDSYDLIEANKLRNILLEQLKTYAFTNLNMSLNNFTFSSTVNLKKRKALIIEKFIQILQKFSLPSGDIDKITKDLIINSKLLQLLKFEGYLQDLGQGVNDLLFVPLKEVMDKFFTFSKTECTSMTDHPLAPIITAKSFFSQKIYGFLNIMNEMEEMNEYSLDYFSKTNKKKDSQKSLQQGTKEKLSGTSLLQNQQRKASMPSLVNFKSQGLASLTQIQEETANKNSDKNNNNKSQQNLPQKVIFKEISPQGKASQDIFSFSKGDTYSQVLPLSQQKTSENCLSPSSFQSSVISTTPRNQNLLKSPASKQIRNQPASQILSAYTTPTPKQQGKDLSSIALQNNDKGILSYFKSFGFTLIEDVNSYLVSLNQLKYLQKAEINPTPSQQKIQNPSIQVVNARGSILMKEVNERKSSQILNVENGDHNPNRKSKIEVSKIDENSSQQVREQNSQNAPATVQQNIGILELTDEDNYNLFIKNQMLSFLTEEKISHFPSSQNVSSQNIQQNNNLSKFECSLGQISSEDEQGEGAEKNLKGQIDKTQNSKVKIFSKRIIDNKRNTISSFNNVVGIKEKNLSTSKVKAAAPQTSIFEEKMLAQISSLDQILAGNETVAANLTNQKEIRQQFLHSNEFQQENAILLSKIFSVQLEDLIEIFNQLSSSK